MKEIEAWQPFKALGREATLLTTWAYPFSLLVDLRMT